MRSRPISSFVPYGRDTTDPWDFEFVVLPGQLTFSLIPPLAAHAKNSSTRVRPMFVAHPQVKQDRNRCTWVEVKTAVERAEIRSHSKARAVEFVAWQDRRALGWQVVLGWPSLRRAQWRPARQQVVTASRFYGIRRVHQRVVY